MTDDRKAFFSALAIRWDEINPSAPQRGAMEAGLDMMGDLTQAMVVDVGCGTGALVERVLGRLGPEARLVALDFAPEMIAQARGKIADPRVEWLVADVVEAPIEAASAQAVLCYNTFPHFPRPQEALAAFARWLRPEGRLLIWHDAGRERINSIHQGVGPPIEGDLLLPVEDLALLCVRTSLVVLERGESERGYRLLARLAR